jgi:hypothetical protein
VNQQHTRPTTRRAQGRARVPWPVGMTADRDQCAVALEVIVARVRADGALEPELNIPWVGWGAPHPTLDALLGKAFRSPAREIVRFEAASIGKIDPACPLRLERRMAFPDARVFLEALVLPCGAREAAELSALLRGGGPALARHQSALQYTRSLEERWAAPLPNPHAPMRRPAPRLRHHPRSRRPHQQRAGERAGELALTARTRIAGATPRQQLAPRGR